MIFSKEDYTYIPPELEDVFTDSTDEVEDIKTDDEEMSHAMPEPKWEWPNGKNSPEYNAWYWDTHKDEIMARREELRKEREHASGIHDLTYESNPFNLDYEADLRRATEENLNKYNASLADRRNARTAVDRELLNRRGALERHRTNNNTAKANWSKGKTEKDDSKSNSTETTEKKEQEKSSKKKSGSGGSGGSSKKSSSKKGSKSSNGSGSKKSSGGGGKSSSSGSKKSSGSSSDKEKSSKEAKEKASTKSSNSSKGSTSEELVKRTSVSGKTYNYDKTAMDEIENNFSKIASVENDNPDSPERNYVAFMTTLRNNGYHEVDMDEGLELWEMYREFRGYKTSDKEIKEEMEREEKRKLQHGMDTFENALEHHGILGMKWYIRNGPPYPLGDGDHNAAEKKAGWESSLSSASRKALNAERKAAAGAKKAYETAKPIAKKAAQSVKTANNNRKAKKAAKREAQAERAREEYQRNRSNAIKGGDAKYAREHFLELSNDEVNELLGRLDLSKRVDKANNIKTAADKIDDFVDNITKVKNWTDKGSSAWNSFAKLYNTMNGNDPLPIIGDDFNETKRRIAEREQERAEKYAKKEREKAFNRIVKDNDAIKRNLYDMTPSELAEAKKAVNNRISILDSLEDNAGDSGNQNKNSNDGISKTDIKALRKEFEALSDRIDKLEEDK